MRPGGNRRGESGGERSGGIYKWEGREGAGGGEKGDRSKEETKRKKRNEGEGESNGGGRKGEEEERRGEEEREENYDSPAPRAEETRTDVANRRATGANEN